VVVRCFIKAALEYSGGLYSVTTLRKTGARRRCVATMHDCAWISFASPAAKTMRRLN
jgi:hypothetical protein